jgi:ABC-type Fe3+-hydroxamate transport system substrate-binding protein
MRRGCGGSRVLAPLNPAIYDAPMRGIRLVSDYLGLLFIVLLMVGCTDEPSANPSTETPDNTDPRLVTVAPALSQMIVDLGLVDAIVGVAEYETAAPAGLPIVGNYNEVNTEALLSTNPTHVLMMVGPGGAPGRVNDLAGRGLFELYTYPFPLSIEDIGLVLYNGVATEGAEPSLGEALGVPGRAMALKMRMLRRLAAIGSLTAALEKPTVLLVIGTGPVMVSGPGTVHDELLGFAGALNAAADATVTAPEYGRESLLALSPQVVLFLQPDAPELKDNDPRLASFAGLPIPAIQDGRVYVINDPLVLLPSTSITRICAQMAKAIHPEVAEQIDRIMGDLDDDVSVPQRGGL